MPMFEPNVNPQTLQGIFDIVGPGSAGQYFGQQSMMQQDMNQVNQQLSLADLAKIQEENRQSSVMNPMLADVQRAKSRQANLQTDDYFNIINQGAMGEARTKKAQGDFDTQTNASKISTQLSANEAAKIKDIGSNLIHAGSYVSGLPPGERHEALMQIAGEMGIQNPAWVARLLKLSPEDIPKALEKMGNTLMNADPKLQAQLIQHRETNAANIKIGAGHDAATRYSADSRKKDTSREMQSTWMKLTDDKRAGYLDGLIEQAKASGEQSVDFMGQTIHITDAERLAKTYTQKWLLGKEVGAPKAQFPGIPMSNPAAAGANAIYPGATAADEALFKKYGIGVKK